MVYFVESSKAAADLIAANLKSLGIENRFQILKAPAVKALTQMEDRGTAADFVFLDPPYRMREDYGQTLTVLAGSKLVRPSSLVIAEHDKKFDPGDEHGLLHRYRTLIQGDAGLSFYRRGDS